MRSGCVRLFTLALFALGVEAAPTPEASMAFIDAEIAAHPRMSGAYVLDSAEEALMARAWLADHARRSIDVQYFIWSTDNIGTLAAEALLRAADRGVKVRVIVDDLLMDAPDESLLALARHPNFDIKIYNPKVSVGVPWYRRAWNAMTDLRAVNQRMHDKTFIVDGVIAITGGRNMAAEYYDYHHDYNFRDRDALAAGEVVQAMQASFERFWKSEYSAAVEQLIPDGFARGDSASAYRSLHTYAADPANFAPGVRAAIEHAEMGFLRLARDTAWGRVEFISDVPGKNTDAGFAGGGRTTRALAELIAGASKRIVMQSPYLVPSDGAVQLFANALARKVEIKINTNSLASTDNLQAFSGYRNQRSELLRMGLKVFEYRPDAELQGRARASEMVRGLPAAAKPAIFGLHAKTLVIDSKIVFIGTFNLDPRSENLNTEVGVVIYDERVASEVERAIEADMRPENSWNAADDPDQHADFGKRAKVRLLQFLPIKPLL